MMTLAPSDQPSPQQSFRRNPEKLTIKQYLKVRTPDGEERALSPGWFKRKDGSKLPSDEDVTRRYIGELRDHAAQCTGHTISITLGSERSPVEQNQELLLDTERIVEDKYLTDDDLPEGFSPATKNIPVKVIGYSWEI